MNKEKLQWNKLIRSFANPTKGLAETFESSLKPSERYVASDNKSGTFGSRGDDYGLDAQLNAIREKYANLPGAGGGGGGFNPRMMDLTQAINARTQAADAAKASVRERESSNRQALLDYITKVQEQAARDKQTQKENYNAARSDLEEQAYMTGRNTRTAAASRGLGASGLETLGQVQANIQAGKEGSNLSNKNVKVLTDIIEGLKKEQEANKKQTEASIRAEDLDIRNIEAGLAKEIADMRLQAEQDYNNQRMQSAAMARSGSSAALDLALRQLEEEAIAKQTNQNDRLLVSQLLKNFSTGMLGNVGNNWFVGDYLKQGPSKKLYNETMASIIDLGLSNPKSIINAQSQLENYYKNMLQTYGTKSKDVKKYY